MQSLELLLSHVGSPGRGLHATRCLNLKCAHWFCLKLSLIRRHWTNGSKLKEKVRKDSGRKEDLNIPHVKYGASVPGTSQEQFRCKTSGAKRGNLLYSATITASSTVFTSGYLS